MSKIAITADSTCDLSPEIIKKYNIEIIPLSILMGEDSFLDGVGIVADEIFDFVSKTGILPKTAAVTIAEYIDRFTRLTNEGYDIIHISLSSEMSSSYQNANIAIEDVDGGNIFIVDSRNLSTGSGHLAIEARVMADNGMEAKDIVDKLNELVPRVDASFVLDNLEYLYKGGRCSAVAMLGANLLKLKPSIQVADGKMGIGKKYKGSIPDSVRKYVYDKLHMPDTTYKRDRIFITTSCPTRTDLIEIAREEIEKTGLFDEILVTRAGCTITSHCGMDVLGVLFIKEN